MDILLMTARLDQETGYEGKGDFVADENGHLRRARDVSGEPVIYAGAGIIHPASLIRLCRVCPRSTAISMKRLQQVAFMVCQ